MYSHYLGQRHGQRHVPFPLALRRQAGGGQVSWQLFRAVGGFPRYRVFQQAGRNSCRSRRVSQSVLPCSILATCTSQCHTVCLSQKSVRVCHVRSFIVPCYLTSVNAASGPLVCKCHANRSSLVRDFDKVSRMVSNRSYPGIRSD